MNWMRVKLPPMAVASVSTASVLARPGTPSRRQWPPASRQVNMRSSARCCPTMTDFTWNSARSRSAPSAVRTTFMSASVARCPTGATAGAGGIISGPTPPVRDRFPRPTTARSGWRWPCRRPRTSSAGRSRPPVRSSSVSSVVISRAPEHPSGWPRAMAPPLTFTLSMSGWSSLLPRQHHRSKGLVDLDQVDVVETRPDRARILWVAGMGAVSMSRDRRRRGRSRRTGPGA